MPVGEGRFAVAFLSANSVARMISIVLSYFRSTSESSRRCTNSFLNPQTIWSHSSSSRVVPELQ